MRLFMVLPVVLLLLAGCSNTRSEETPESSASSSSTTEPFPTERVPDTDSVQSECELEGSIAEDGETSVIGEGSTAYGDVTIDHNESGQSRATYTITVYLDVTRERWVSMELSVPSNDHTWRVNNAQMQSFTYPDAPEDLWVPYAHISLEHDGTGGSFEVNFALNDDHDQVVLEVDVESLTCEDIST